MDWTLLALCAFSFLAGFIDSIVGGGGLVQVPAFFVLYPHLAVPNVIATNRIASAVGTSVAAWNYSRVVKIIWPVVFAAGAGAAVMSYLGATLQSRLPSEVLKPIILVLILAVAVYTYKKKELGQVDNFQVREKQIPWLALLVGAALGFYNGLIGPGTGSLLVFGFVSVIGYNFLAASAMSKVINVVADLASLVFFLAQGYVMFELALPLLIFNVAGSFLGSRMAVLRGNAFVRRFFLFVVGLILLRFAWDVAGIWWKG